MKRIVIIVLCLAATALVATSCSHQSQGPPELPGGIGWLARQAGQCHQACACGAVQPMRLGQLEEGEALGHDGACVSG